MNASDGFSRRLIPNPCAEERFSYGIEPGWPNLRYPKIHPQHNAILHLLGLDHKRLTFNYGGRDFRLTDVYGNVVKGILA